MDFLKKHFSRLEGEYFCISYRTADTLWKDTYFERKDIDKIESFLDEYSCNDLYFALLGVKDKKRRNEDVVPSKLLFADIDDVDPSEFDELPPSVLIESSPGRYVGIWYTDFYYTPEINQRLTHRFGFDPGGWDPGQVLRIPGTVNYKYAARPKVKLIYDDGPTYTYNDICKVLPEGKVVAKKKKSFHQVYSKHEKSLDGETRETLNAKKFYGKDRSRSFWKLINKLIEFEIPEDDIFTLVRDSPINKFNGRNGDERLSREIKRAIDKSFQVIDEGETEDDLYSMDDLAEPEEDDVPFFAYAMDQVEEEVLDWLWKPYLARGEVTILESDPGLGKSYWAQVVSGAICDGRKLTPTLDVSFDQGRVCYLDFENSAGTVTKRRLIDNGVKKLNNFFQEETAFSIDDPIALNKLLIGLGQLKPSLVVFDTINSYIGKADINKGSDTQQAFRIFVDIARRYHCSVLVLRHLTKNSTGPAIYRGSGSIAFTGLARVVLTMARNPENTEEVIGAVVKLNVAKKPKPFKFRIKSLPDKGKFTDRSEFVFLGESNLDIEDALQGRVTESDQSANYAKQWLMQFLKDNGEVDKNVVIDAAREKGIDQGELITIATTMVERRVENNGETRVNYWKLIEEI